MLENGSQSLVGYFIELNGTVLIPQDGIPLRVARE